MTVTSSKFLFGDTCLVMRVEPKLVSSALPSLKRRARRSQNRWAATGSGSRGTTLVYLGCAGFVRTGLVGSMASLVFLILTLSLRKHLGLGFDVFVSQYTP